MQFTRVNGINLTCYVSGPAGVPVQAQRIPGARLMTPEQLARLLLNGLT